jgi:hypothetical protein
MMDPVSAQRLAEITAKEPAALTEEDIGFMRARRSYLTSDQREIFKGQLSEELAQEPDAEPPSGDKPPKKK